MFHLSFSLAFQNALRHSSISLHKGSKTEGILVLKEIAILTNYGGKKNLTIQNA